MGAVDGGRLVFGHTHLAFARTGPHGVELVNPGSVGMPFDGDHRAAYAVVRDGGAIEHRRVAYDHQASADAIRERIGEAGEQAALRVERASFDDMIIERSLHPDWLSNTYLVGDEPGGKAVAIDAGGPSRPLMEKAESEGLEVTHLLLTHHHHDHVVEAQAWKDRFGARVLAHPLEAERVETCDGTIERGGGAVGRRPHDRRPAHAGAHGRDAQLPRERRRRLHRRHALQGLGRRREGAALDLLRRPQDVDHGRADEAAARRRGCIPATPTRRRSARSGSRTRSCASGAGSTPRGRSPAPSGSARRRSSYGRPTTTAATRPGSAGRTQARTTSCRAPRSSARRYWPQTGHWPGPDCAYSIAARMSCSASGACDGSAAAAHRGPRPTENWYLPWYVPSALTAVGSPPDSHCGDRLELRRDRRRPARRPPGASRALLGDTALDGALRGARVSSRRSACWRRVARRRPRRNRARSKPSVRARPVWALQSRPRTSAGASKRRMDSLTSSVGC